MTLVIGFPDVFASDDQDFPAILPRGKGRGNLVKDLTHPGCAPALKKALQANPNFLIAHLILAATYSSLGRDAEAAAASQEVLRLNPRFTLEAHARTLPYKNKADRERELVALWGAGLK